MYFVNVYIVQTTQIQYTQSKCKNGIHK